jgi:hypothetical protein
MAVFNGDPSATRATAQDVPKAQASATTSLLVECRPAHSPGPGGRAEVPSPELPGIARPLGEVAKTYTSLLVGRVRVTGSVPVSSTKKAFFQGARLKRRDYPAEVGGRNSPCGA